MKPTLESLQHYLQAQYPTVQVVITPQRELQLDVPARNWIDVCHFLRHDNRMRLEQLIDLCGVDYLSYGQSEWDVADVSATGFSRAVTREEPDPFAFDDDDSDQPVFEGQRFAVVVQLLSLKYNIRVRARTFCEDNEQPQLPSLIHIWQAANWYEREAFDLYGILFENHPDLRRLLTDYGFVGHPFRKDFPLSGHVEMRYDPLQQRVIYEPVTIEPRTLVPRVIRAARDSDTKG